MMKKNGKRKNGKGSNRKRNGRILAAAAAVLLATVLMHRPVSLKEGQEYLKNQDILDTAPTQKRIYALEENRMRQQKEEGNFQYQLLLPQIALLGDSRAADLSNFGLVPSSQNFSAYGEDISCIPSHLEELQRLQPRYILICYGINDVVRNVRDGISPEEFSVQLNEQLESIQEVCPDSQICISSILDVSSTGLSQYPQWNSIPEFNTAIENVCKGTGFRFLDNSSCPQGPAYPEVYRPDGFHFTQDACEDWLENMIFEATLSDSLADV